MSSHTVSPAYSLNSCFNWILASFGKLAIRTILWEYVYVSLVFLPINSWSKRGHGSIFHLTAAAAARAAAASYAAPFGALAVISLPCSHYRLSPASSSGRPTRRHSRAAKYSPSRGNGPDDGGQSDTAVNHRITSISSS